MNPEHFLTQPSQENKQSYSGKLLNIIHADSERRKQIRTLESSIGDPLDKELHQQRFYDSRAEIESCTPTREDIAESFGINLDEEHMIFYPQPGEKKEVGTQRAFRAFVVLSDAVLGESFYGEGRTMHNSLLKMVIQKFKEQNGDPRPEEEILDEIGNTNGEFIFIKGFLSDDGFANMSPQNKHALETPIHDKTGGIVETPKNWFVTGHNISEDLENS